MSEGLVTRLARQAGLGTFKLRDRSSIGACTTGQKELIHTAPDNFAKSAANYIYGENYKVLPAEKMLGFADKVASRFGVTEDQVDVKVHTLESGFPSLVTGLIRTGQIYRTAAGEEYELTQRFREGFDGKVGYRHLFGAFRFWCENGQYIGEKLWECSGKHSGKVEDIILPSVEVLRGTFVSHCNRFEREKQTYIGGDEFRKALYAVVNGVTLKDWDRYANAMIRRGEKAEEGDPVLPSGIRWAETNRRQRTYVHSETAGTGTVDRINAVVDVIDGCKHVEAGSPAGYGDTSVWDLRQHATWYTTHGENSNGKPISLRERDAAEKRATKVLL